MRKHNAGQSATVLLGIDVGGSAVSYAIFDSSAALSNANIVYQGTYAIKGQGAGNKAAACEAALLEHFTAIYQHALNFGAVECIGVGFPGKRQSFGMRLEQVLMQKTPLRTPVYFCEDAEAYLIGIIQKYALQAKTGQFAGKKLGFLGIGSGFGSASVHYSLAVEDDFFTHVKGTGLWNSSLNFLPEREEDAECLQFLSDLKVAIPYIADNLFSKTGYTYLCRLLAESGRTEEPNIIIGNFMGNSLGNLLEQYTSAENDSGKMPQHYYWLAGGILHEHAELKNIMLETACSYLKKYAVTHEIELAYEDEYLAPLGAAAMAAQRHLSCGMPS